MKPCVKIEILRFVQHVRIQMFDTYSTEILSLDHESDLLENKIKRKFAAVYKCSEKLFWKGLCENLISSCCIEFQENYDKCKLSAKLHYCLEMILKAIKKGIKLLLTSTSEVHKDKKLNSLRKNVNTDYL